MIDDDELREIRNRLDALGRRARRLGGQGVAGTDVQAGIVFNSGAIPTTTPKFYSVHPASVQAAGIETSAPETGCCGMAGSFGFRPDTYSTSVKIANLSLLPKVNGTKAETLIVANGFSCREQIEDLTERDTLHLADVLARTLS